MRGLEKVAGLSIATDCYSVEDLLDMSTADRDRISYLLMDSRGGGALTLREILEAKSPPPPLGTCEEAVQHPRGGRISQIEVGGKFEKSVGFFFP